jgi:hypothetical protein
MGQNANIPNFANVNLFKVGRGETFTVPDTEAQASPSGISSGLSPANIFDTRRLGVGGYIFAAFSDVAGPATEDFQWKINPGDVIAVSAASPAIVSQNGTQIFTITNTAVCGILAYHS